MFPDKAIQSSNFIRNIIEEDLRKNKNEGRVVTRFPPEPNGYLHIGHAKSICINFGLAADYPGGVCHLRFDDTNPSREEEEYVKSIMEDVKWLGFNWGDHMYYASDYFDSLYGYAIKLIKTGKAYVCSLSAEEIREFRGTLTEPGKDSPFRDRPVEENLQLFERMRSGEFEDGSHVLRAKIDMSSPNLNMRDPVMYRIQHSTHQRTGGNWPVYPMYDFAHCLSDSIEGITHSICTLEFEDHRPLYDWFLDELKVACHPRQIEFARLNLSYTVMSKRKLLELVEGSHVSGWDDPRLPTLGGMRRRGYTPEAIRTFCERIGVGKKESVIDVAMLEECVREDLNARAKRVMGIINPVRLIIDNFPQNSIEEFDVPNHPNDPEKGIRKVPFGRELFIERDDFMEDPPKKFFRLAPGREVRLKYSYFVKCTGVIKDDKTGEVLEIHCTYDPETRGGSAPDARKVKGTLHWVSAARSLKAEVRLYDRLFLTENPSVNKDGADYRDNLNPDSLKIPGSCFVEPGLAGARPGETYQFERLGYFCVDSRDSSSEALVFNRTVTLRDSWSKLRKG